MAAGDNAVPIRTEQGSDLPVPEHDAMLVNLFQQVSFIRRWSTVTMENFARQFARGGQPSTLDHVAWQQTGVGEIVAILVAADAWYTRFQKTARSFDGLERSIQAVAQVEKSIGIMRDKYPAGRHLRQTGYREYPILVQIAFVKLSRSNRIILTLAVAYAILRAKFGEPVIPSRSIPFQILESVVVILPSRSICQ